jgi:hypothetical protein
MSDQMWRPCLLRAVPGVAVNRRVFSDGEELSEIQPKKPRETRRIEYNGKKNLQMMKERFMDGETAKLSKLIKTIDQDN